MKTNIVSIFFVLVALVIASSHARATDFPGRQESKYKDLKTLDIEELYNDFLEHRALIVDVRSTLEFETIHIKDAQHLSISDGSFVDKLKTLSTKEQGKKIAFY